MGRFSSSVWIAGLVGFVLGVGVSAAWFSRGDFMSCVVENMRGQPANTLPFAHQHCINKYGNPN